MISVFSFVGSCAGEASHTKELSDADLEAVAGSDGFCVVGASDDVDAKNGYGVIRACAFLGVSFG